MEAHFISPLSTGHAQLPELHVIRGWGLYFCKAHVRRLFHRLDGWLVRRIWSHRFKRWRNAGWKRLPQRQLYEEFGLVKLIALIPSLNLR
jgi:hypothetical protein